MPTFYSPGAMASVATKTAQARGLTPSLENFSFTLNERVSTKSPPLTTAFDIFLSYRADEIRYVLGVYDDLLHRGLSVYLDRVMDPHLDRNNVTKETCTVLRNRLVQSKSLFYIATDDASASKWMPWELGFEDGYRGKSAILPVTDKSEFRGAEFVTLYPKVALAQSNLWICDADGKAHVATFEVWRQEIPQRACGMPRCPIPRT